MDDEKTKLKRIEKQFITEPNRELNKLYDCLGKAMQEERAFDYKAKLWTRKLKGQREYVSTIMERIKKKED